MRALLLILCLCGLTHADDYWVITDKPAPDVTKCVYSVRVRHAQGTTSGSAVSIGDGTLQTVAHLWGSGGVTEVEVDGQWVPANYRIVSPPDQNDVALLRVARADLAKADRTAPVYGQTVYVYGQASKCLQRGTVAGGYVILDPAEDGVIQGDSGGGVFSESGEFVGTIGGYLTDEKRVTVFAPNTFAVNTNPPAAKPLARANCPNGKCPLR